MIHIDIETADIDDVLTLLWLRNYITSISITPGRPDQVRLVDYLVCKYFDTVPKLFYRGYKPEKTCVSGNYYKIFPIQEHIIKNDWALFEPSLLHTIHKQNPDLVFFSGGPVTNIANYVRFTDIPIKEYVAQGGFAGKLTLNPLPKFAGKDRESTFNLGGDIVSAEYILASSKILKRYFISKDICHSFIYQDDFSNSVLGDILAYFSGKDKKLHDLLAAQAIFKKDLFSFEQVKMDCVKGKWGCVASTDSNTYISVGYDFDKSYDLLKRTQDAYR